MRPIQVVILLVAFVAAGSAGMIAMNLAKSPKPKAEKAATQEVVPSEEVLVAARDINMGSGLGGDAVTWKKWPKDGISDGYIVKSARPDALKELEGSLTRAAIFSGEPIREAKLVRSNQGFLSAVLPKGMRAVAVRVTAASTAGGFVLPNDRIDVILTRQSANAAGTSAVSETIITNVRVLAIDQTIQNVTGEQQASVVAQDTATLELTPEQAELITQAQQMGTISLALRSIADAGDVDNRKPERVGGVNLVRYGVSTRVQTRETPVPAETPTN